MKYLKQFNNELIQRYSIMFTSGDKPTDENFYRDSERFQTIEDLVNLTFEDMEQFYDTGSVG